MLTCKRRSCLVYYNHKEKRKGDKKMIKVRDSRDGWTIEVSTMEEAINICIHDWNMEIVEE
jgi:hypothetical protein